MWLACGRFVLDLWWSKCERALQHVYITPTSGSAQGARTAPNSFSTDPAKVSFSTEVPCLMNIMWQAQQQRPSSQAQVRPSLLLVLPCSPPTNTFTDFIDRSLARIITRALTGPFTRFFCELISSFSYWLTYSLVHLLSDSFSHWLSSSITQLLNRSLAVTDSFTDSLTHSCTGALTRALVHWGTDSIIHSLLYSLTHSLIYWLSLTHSLTHSCTGSLGH